MGFKPQAIDLNTMNSTITRELPDNAKQKPVITVKDTKHIPFWANKDTSDAFSNAFGKSEKRNETTKQKPKDTSKQKPKDTSKKPYNNRAGFTYRPSKPEYINDLCEFYGLDKTSLIHVAISELWMKCKINH